MQSFSELSEITSMVKGPAHLTFQEIKPKGDLDNPRETLAYHRASALSQSIVCEGSSKIEVITKKMENFARLSQKLFPQYHQSEGVAGWSRRPTHVKKKVVGKVSSEQKKVIYFGHENWNILLNMMLGIRKSIKSHFYQLDEDSQFTEEDLNCKYPYDLMYKQNNKSVKEIS
jgi:1-phosphatidylinositol-4-phosphate 5-kinase